MDHLLEDCNKQGKKSEIDPQSRPPRWRRSKSAARPDPGEAMTSPPIADDAGAARVVRVNVAAAGGVPKLPVVAALLTTHGVAGDRQLDLKHHGGPDRAVCLFASEHIAALAAEGHPIAPGTTGENLTIAGLDWHTLQAGDRLAVADGVLLRSPDPPRPAARSPTASWTASSGAFPKPPGLAPSPPRACSSRGWCARERRSGACPRSPRRAPTTWLRCRSPRDDGRQAPTCPTCRLWTARAPTSPWSPDCQPTGAAYA